MKTHVARETRLLRYFYSYSLKSEKTLNSREYKDFIAFALHKIKVYLTLLAYFYETLSAKSVICSIVNYFC